jgi:hypothetical protein
MITPVNPNLFSHRNGFTRLVLKTTSFKSFLYPKKLPACSLGLSATSQQYFSLTTNQPPATSRNQPAVLFSHNKPAPAISHQPTEQAVLLHENSWGSSSHPSLVFSLVYLQHSITFLMPTYSSRKIFVDVELQLEFSPYI